MNNDELVQKALITTDALASSGKLNPAQADKFIDYVIDITGLKNNARIVRFRNEQLQIDKIGVGKRVAMPAAEAVSPQQRRGVTTSKVTLQPVEIIVPFEIGDSFREINIEGDDVEDHIVRMMATQTANDLETLYIEGQTDGPAVIEGDIVDGGDASKYVTDTYLKLLDGWLKLARGSNVYDAANMNIGSSVFSNLINSLPEKFKRNKNVLRFITSTNLEQKYRERVSTRGTAAGDDALNSSKALAPFGIPLTPFPLFPFKPRIVETVVLNGTTAVQLLHAPISVVTVHPTALPGPLGGAAASFILDTDFTLDTAAGTIARKGGGAISDGDTVKVTYAANPQVLLTHMSNFIVGIGRDITIEKDREIYKRVNQYAIHLKVAVQFEELSAIALGRNIGTGV